MPRVVLLVLAVCSVLAIAACGDDDTKRANSYVEAVNRAQGNFATTFEGLQGDIGRRSTPAQVRRTLRRFERAIDQAVAQLRAVKPPAEVRGLHRHLIAGVASYRGEIARTRRAFASGDRAKFSKAQVRLARAVARISARINRTTNAINDKLHG